MKIAFFINEISTENPFYGTQRLAMEASARLHDVFYIDVDGFIYDSDEHLRALARRAEGHAGDPERFFDVIRDEKSQERISLEELDVLMLRHNPSNDYQDRPWAPSTSVAFGHLAASRGVTVLNDPAGLARASTKLYFQEFPEEVRPRTRITRDPDEIKEFIDAEGGRAVLKPLQGSGGESVFLVTPEEENLNQIIDSVGREGYLVVQEYLPAADEGDIRFFLIDGEPLEQDGKYAAFRRTRPEDDIRSNVREAKTPSDIKDVTQPVEVTDEILALVEKVSAKLRADGMFLVGLDIAGDKLMEINVYSPGGLWSIEQHTGVDFCPVILDAIEARRES